MIKDNIRLNYYEILSIKQNATRKEIVEAYSSKKELNNGNPELLEEAYQVLINPQRRELYNRELDIGGERSTLNIIFDKPGEINKAFVETPNFKKMPHNDIFDQIPEINKQAFKAYVSISKQDTEKKAPSYNIDLELEEKMKSQTEFRGIFFAQVRAYKNMTLGYVSSRTKIPIYHIESIERDDYALLPSRIYLLGFIRSYATLLGLDPEKASRSYIQGYDRVKR